MKRSSLPVLLAAAVVSIVVGATTFVALDRYLEPDFVAAPPEARSITVEVSGAVASPGVVTVSSTARLQNVVDAAGGLAPEADVTSLNMAGRVGDGERVVIPAVVAAASEDPGGSEAAVTTEPTATARPVATEQPAASDASQLVNLNTASAEELEALPGIGPVLAGRIVAYREANGPYRTVDDLADIEGIDTGIVDELRPFVTTGE